MPVPQLSRRAVRAFIAAQHRRGVNRQPIEISPRLFTLGFQVVLNTQQSRFFTLPLKKATGPLKE